ncbi:MAG: lipopolysaccharide kinase InaA family protein [Gemmataceae bacterium]
MSGTLANPTSTPPANLRTVQTGPFRWRIRNNLLDVLLNERGLRLPEWIESGQAQIVKKGPHRIVYRVNLPELSFYIKHNLLHNYRAWLRQLVRPSKARTEHEQISELNSRGIPTLEPLGFGERTDGLTSGESYLITKSLNDTQQLDDFLERTLPTFPTTEQTAIRQQIATSLGQFVARLHETGVSHQDFHCGNILLRWQHGQAHLYLIDLQAVRLQRSLSWSERQTNLVILNRWLSLRSNRTERCRFWKAYLEVLGTSLESETARGLAKSIEQKTRDSNLFFWQRRDRRCRFRNRRYSLIRRRPFRGYNVTDLDKADVESILRDPDVFFRDPNRKILKESKSVKVIEIQVRVAGRDIPAVFKRVEVRRWSDPLASLFRWTPALRSWVYGHGLRERGLPTARPLMVFHRMKWGMATQGYLLMEKVPNSGDVRDLISSLESCKHHQRLLRRRIQQLAWLIRTLHDRGLTHRDLKTPNILVSNETEELSRTSSPFCFIDLVGLSRVKNPGWELRAKNLVRLAVCFLEDPRVTRTDKLRFLRAYLSWDLQAGTSWKRWWRAIQEGMLRKVERNRQLGRPLV